MIDKIFGYIQIIYLGLFLSLVIGKTIYLRRTKKISAIKVNIFSREGQKHGFEIIMFFLVNLWTFFLLAYALHTAFGTFPNIPEVILFNFLPLKILGLLLIISGFVIFILALQTLGNSWRLGIDENNPGKLVTNGIYAISRHPIYLFFNLYFIGTFFINGNLVFLIFAVLLGFVLHLQLMREEKFLIKTYGKNYMNYKQSVSQYFNIRLFSDYKKVAYLYRLEDTD
jgi:protein-S-isoprenylcysteine O-methyltransferase Ste14